MYLAEVGFAVNYHHQQKEQKDIVVCLAKRYSCVFIED